MKIRSLQSWQCLRQDQKPAASCFGHNAESPDHSELAILSLTSTIEVVHNQPVSAYRFCQHYCVPLPSIKPVQQRIWLKCHAADS